MSDAPQRQCPDRRRALIFGGTFDPPHLAHVQLSRMAARELGCQRILYIPAAINPLKASPDLPQPAAAHHRLAMLRLALRDVPQAEISTIEIDRAQGEDRPSYTIDTLRGLVGWTPHTTSGDNARSRRGAPPQTAPNPLAVGDAHPTGLFLLIGADQAMDFHRWKEWREILRLARPAVMLRPPWTRDTLAAALRERYDEDEARQWLEWTLHTLPVMDISATEIRQRLREGRSLSDFVPPDVEAYIRDHHLYGDVRDERR